MQCNGGRHETSQDIVEFLPFRRWVFKVLAFLFNCSEPEAITLALARIKSDTELSLRLEQSHVRLGAYANRLTPVDSQWTLADSTAPQPLRQDLKEDQYWNDFVQIWISDFNVKIVGGCCGITPEHISYIHNRLKQTKDVIPH